MALSPDPEVRPRLHGRNPAPRAHVPLLVVDRPAAAPALVLNVETLAPADADADRVLALTTGGRAGAERDVTSPVRLLEETEAEAAWGAPTGLAPLPSGAVLVDPVEGEATTAARLAVIPALAAG